MASVAPGSAQSTAKKPSKQRKLFTLWVHDVHFSAVDLVINPDYFPPETKVGDIVEIYKQGNKEKALYLAIGAVTTIRANLHLSVKDTVASACELTNREEIVANVVSKESVAVDFAEVTFKDQFISRSDMWRLKMHLKETCAYVGKSISYSCIRASIRELLSSEQPVHSGYITANTKIVFRSRSAEYIMLFQMSREMWDFAPDGQLYFEKAVNKFLPSLFTKWRALGADHCLSMVMFSRTYYTHEDLFDLSSLEPNSTDLDDPPLHLCRMDASQQNNLLRDHEGRYYHDFYTVVCIEERTNWERVVLQLKTKFEEYPYMVNWKIYDDANPDKYHSNVLGNNATAEHSGFLEAINLAQNMLDSRHFTDRDLTRTGQSVVVISAGTGIFIVNPSLEQQTKQRMIDKGIGCDLVCVTKPPLHVVPLFIMKRHYVPSTSQSPSQTHPTPLSARSTTNSNSSSSTPSRALTPASPYPFQAGSLLNAQSATKPLKQSFPSHKIAHWVYLFFHDLHVQHDPGSVLRNFTTNCTMPDFLQRNNDCSGIVLPLKMKPNITVRPSSLHPLLPTHDTTDGKITPIGGSFGGLVSAVGLEGLIGAPQNEKTTKVDSMDADRLGMVHHMDMEVHPTHLSAEASQAERLGRLMDAYDGSLFSAPPVVPKPDNHGSGSGSLQSGSASGGIGVNGTPGKGTNFGAPLHHHSTSLLQSPGVFRSSPASHSTLERAATLSGPLSSGGPGSGKKSISSLSVSAAGLRGNSVNTLSPGGILSGVGGVSASVLSSTSVDLARSGIEALSSVSSVSGVKTPMKSSSGSGAGYGGVLADTEGVEAGVMELNPFTLELKPAPPASNRRRWEHLWVRHSIQFDFLESDPSGPHWKSLTQPASLPLTTSYFPAQKELKDHFHFYSHSVDPDDAVHEAPLEAHLTEHIAQRLVQGAQLMLPDGASLNPNNAYLSAGNSFHNLTIKQPNIIVNWYVAKNKILHHQPIPYKYFLWTEHTSRRLSKAIDLHYKSIIHYPWNTLDQLLSGYQLEFMDNYNYWHINIMLVPTDSKMSTQAAINGFNKFKEILTQRAVKLHDPDFGPMQVQIHTPVTTHPSNETEHAPTSSNSATNSNPSSTANSVNATNPSTISLSASSSFSSFAAASSSQGSFKGKSTQNTVGSTNFSSAALVPELIESHNTNLILTSLKESNLVNEHFMRKGEREKKGSEKTNIFIASKVVDWMLTHVSVRNRTEAIDICDGFVSNGIFVPISLPKDSKFRDGANFFAIVDPLAAPSSHTASPITLAASASSISASLKSNSAHGRNQGNVESPGSAPIERRQASTPGPFAGAPPQTSQSHKMITPSSQSSATPTHKAPLNVLQSLLAWKRSSTSSAKELSIGSDTTNALITNEALEAVLGGQETTDKMELLKNAVLSAVKDPEHPSLSVDAAEYAKSLAIFLKPHTTSDSGSTPNKELMWLFDVLVDLHVVGSKPGVKTKLKTMLDQAGSSGASRGSVKRPIEIGTEPSATISDAGILMVSEELNHHDPQRLRQSSSVAPGSQPMESSPLDLAAGGGNVGSGGALSGRGVSNVHGGVIPLGVTHQYSDPSFTRAEKVVEDPVPSLPHHTHAPSGTIRLAMDPSKTDRYEWVNVVYDTIFDPSVAYEFQFQWLCSTGCVLSEFITQLTRKARGLGFSLIQIPVKHDVVHSFLSPRKDSFSWADLPSAHQLAVCHVLVKVLDFLPRKRANQFIHRSGVIIIDISNNIFEWTVNWTDVNAYTTAQNFELLKRFRDFMHQVALLKAQTTAGQPEMPYQEFLAGLLQKVAPFSAQSLPTHSPTPHDPSES